jgi:hypothetical protein
LIDKIQSYDHHPKTFEVAGGARAVATHSSLNRSIKEDTASESNTMAGQLSSVESLPSKNLSKTFGG